MSISFQVEPFETFYAAALPLFPQHYEELALNKNEVKLELDVARYEDAERNGILHISTMRDDGRLVGYFVAAILRHLHYASLICASTDMYWIVPEFRVHGARFFSFILDDWKKRGVRKAYVSTKVHEDKQEFLEALGFSLSDKMFTRML